MLKGKLKLGLFGIAFAPLAVAGAVRLAKPAAAVLTAGGHGRARLVP